MVTSDLISISNKLNNQNEDSRQLHRRVQRVELTSILIVLYLLFFPTFHHIEDVLRSENSNNIRPSPYVSYTKKGFKHLYQLHHQPTISRIELDYGTKKSDCITSFRNIRDFQEKLIFPKLDYPNVKKLQEDPNRESPETEHESFEDIIRKGCPYIDDICRPHKISAKDIPLISITSNHSLKDKDMKSKTSYTRLLKDGDSLSTICTTNEYRIELHVEYEKIEENLFPGDVSWELLDLSAKTAIHQTSFKNEFTSSSSSHFACLDSGRYRLTVLNEKKSRLECRDCYQVLINGNEIIFGNNILGQSTHFFYITKDGTGREQVCPYFPTHSPMNFFNNFQYDTNITRILDVIYSLSSIEAVHTRDTPQYKATCWIIYDDISENKIPDNFFVERYTMAVLLFALNQDAELLPVQLCDYDEGKVRCGSKGYIEEITLDMVSTEGFIPPEIGHLKFIRTLSLWGNKLKGKIPLEIDQLKRIRKLDLGNNDINGPIPTGIGKLIQLEALLLHKNRITGTIPSQIMKCAELRELFIDSNHLEGTIPTELFECKKLTTLFCFFNHLSGTIPSNIANLQAIQWLGFGTNQLNGTIPTHLGQLPSLKFLYLQRNAFIGQVPDELGNIKTLQLFWVYGNMLTGTLPNTFNDLDNVKFIDFSSNIFTGSIPTAFWNFESVIQLSLQNNALKGNVPRDLCNKMRIGESFQTPYPKTELRFQVPWFAETVSDLQVDDSKWFIDNPLVNCSCCSASSCYLWDMISTKITAQCPSMNVLTFPFYKTYDILDYTADVKLFHTIGSIFGDAQACLSPSGCYNVSFFENDEHGGMKKNFSIGYSSSSQTLTNDKCDDVNVCGTSITRDDPKRKMLNHITQLALPDITHLNDPTSPEYKAICWLILKDEMADKFEVCDGSLMQRYILIYLYFAQRLQADFVSLASKHTCDWPGVKCESSNKFIEVLNLSHQALEGSLISEIGLLKRLRNLNLSNNLLKGTIDPAIFTHLPFMEVFDVASNRFEGEIPHLALSLPQLKVLRLSKNNFVGSLPNSIDYTQSLEYFEVRDNLLQGIFPPKLLECKKLKQIDLSRNHFDGRIPTGISGLKHLKIIKLNENHFSGSIPSEIFHSRQIEVLMLQSNEITGMISSRIADLDNITTITLNHNELKGTIPSEMMRLQKLELLHLHMNQLIGKAPDLTFIGESTHNQYISDCGDPLFHLPSLLSCPSCTMCCNSLEKCQENKELKTRFWIMAIFGLPVFTASVRFIIVKAGIDIFHVFNDIETEPFHVLTLDSVYCFILTKSIMAWILYLVTVVIQVLLFAEYIGASSVKSENTDWNFTFRCPRNTIECEDESSRTRNGWILFFLVTGSYLGADFVKSLRQLQKAVLTLNWQLFLSGFLLFCLTMLALFASTVYNIALAESNTDLIMNTVILLFINDMDEKILIILESLAPVWTRDRIDDVRRSVSVQERNLQPFVGLSFKYNHKFDQTDSNEDLPRFPRENNIEFMDIDFRSNIESCEYSVPENDFEASQQYSSEEILVGKESVEIQIPKQV